VKHVLHFLVVAAAMVLMSNTIPGFHVTGWGPALWAAFVLAVFNVIVKPILFVLTLPFTIVTLGLFLLVLNAIVLWLVAAVVPGFHIDGFVPAFFGALVLSLIGMIWKAATRKDGRRARNAS
jgi:putative membrane protein